MNDYVNYMEWVGDVMIDSIWSMVSSRKSLLGPGRGWVELIGQRQTTENQFNLDASLFLKKAKVHVPSSFTFS